MTPRKREQRLNPMPRRRPKAEPPGHEWWVLGASAVCECGWQGLATTREEARQMWVEHFVRAGHNPETTYRIEED